MLSGHSRRDLPCKRWCKGSECRDRKDEAPCAIKAPRTCLSNSCASCPYVVSWTSIELEAFSILCSKMTTRSRTAQPSTKHQNVRSTNPACNASTADPSVRVERWVGTRFLAWEENVADNGSNALHFVDSRLGLGLQDQLLPERAAEIFSYGLARRANSQVDARNLALNVWGEADAHVREYFVDVPVGRILRYTVLICACRLAQRKSCIKRASLQKPSCSVFVNLKRTCSID